VAEDGIGENSATRGKIDLRIMFGRARDSVRRSTDGRQGAVRLRPGRRRPALLQMADLSTDPPVWPTVSLPAGVWLPDQGVPSYRGRG
jgi:hypothetical protein